MNLSISPLSEGTGAVATGVDLRGPIDDHDRYALNQAFVEHCVLVLRDQQLSPAQLLDAVQLFGTIFEQHNTRFSLPKCPQIHYISNHDRYPDGTRYIPGNGYHTDHSNARCPPKATVLHAVELPDRGGDTQFVNMHLAYQSLEPTLKARIEDLRAVHVYQSRHSARQLMGLTEERQPIVPQQVSHPIVRTHPESGRRSIYINPIRIDGIDGFEEAQALELLDQLLEHSVQEAHEYRHQWQPGDLTLWDNRCLLHKANADYDMQHTRYLYRVMLEGDEPV